MTYSINTEIITKTGKSIIITEIKKLKNGMALITGKDSAGNWVNIRRKATITTKFGTNVSFTLI